MCEKFIQAREQQIVVKATDLRCWALRATQTNNFEISASMTLIKQFKDTQIGIRENY